MYPMKKFSVALIALFLSICTYAQDPALAPFYHGVASGDALTDKVILWTRVTPDIPGTLTVEWLIATDTLFTDIVNSGTATTDSSKDYTVKVDATGLQPDTWYYYIFKHEGQNSLIGRTRTLPDGNTERIRLAVASCSNYTSGDYFNAYLSIARRNDIHAVIHLGDYIYEYPGGGLSGEGIPILPNTETTTLDKYRARYSTYRLDPSLRRLHQQYPFYTVWDDHETANNSWSGGAENHTQGSEGDWQVRKQAGQQANFEWLPRREKAQGDFSIYQTFNFGNLADLIMLDTRLEGRDEQASSAGGYQDTNRTILGTTQRTWLLDELSNSQAKWKIIGQQVMFAPLIQTTFTNDMWDGYEGDRNRIINHVMNNSIDNVVVLTGDIHSSWANDVPQEGVNYNASTGAGSAFVEFICSSITSGSGGFNLNAQTVQLLAPHVKYLNLTNRGYLVLDIDSNRAQSDWTYVSNIDNAVFTESTPVSWYVNQGERHVREASAPATGYANAAPFAPLNRDTTNVSVGEISNTLNVTVYPNPFGSAIFIRVNNLHEKNLEVRVYNVLGKLVKETTVPSMPTISMDLSDLKQGAYLLTVAAGNAEFKSTIVKMQ